MAIDFKEIPGRSLKVGHDFQRRYERTFRAVTTDPFVDPQAVYLALGLYPGTPYRTAGALDLFAWVTDVEVSEETASEDGREWTIKVSYGPWEPQAEDPRNNPPEVDLSFVEFEEPVTNDAETGDAVINSAGDLFADPPIMRDQSRVVLTVKRNEPNYSLALAVNYANVTNAAPFRVGDVTFPAKALLCKPIVATRNFHSNCGWYWPTTYQFHGRVVDTWAKQVLDRGFRRLVSGTRKLILNDDCHPVSEPAFLNGSGQPLAVGASPVVLTYDAYPVRDFSVFDGLF